MNVYHLSSLTKYAYFIDLLSSYCVLFTQAASADSRDALNYKHNITDRLRRTQVLMHLYIRIQNYIR